MSDDRFSSTELAPFQAKLATAEANTNNNTDSIREIKAEMKELRVKIEVEMKELREYVLLKKGAELGAKETRYKIIFYFTWANVLLSLINNWSSMVAFLKLFS